MRPRIDPGQMTAGAMLCGILFGWGVLALTRLEVREVLDGLDGRLYEVERTIDLTPAQHERWEKRRRAKQAAEESGDDVDEEGDHG